jgi:hypothetical protein
MAINVREQRGFAGLTGRQRDGCWLTVEFSAP